MKKIKILLIILSITHLGYGQTWKAGIGLQSLAQPFAGGLFELDYNVSQNATFETLSRLSLGYRINSPKHESVGLELYRGYRIKFNKSFYMEQTLGLGAVYSIYEDKYWYKNNWDNLIGTGPKGRTIDIRPSITLGLGYHYGGSEGTLNHLWIRPKVFWQLPTNNPANPDFTLLIGFSRSLKTN